MNQRDNKDFVRDEDAVHPKTKKRRLKRLNIAQKKQEDHVSSDSDGDAGGEHQQLDIDPEHFCNKDCHEDLMQAQLNCEENVDNEIDDERDQFISDLDYQEDNPTCEDFMQAQQSEFESEENFIDNDYDSDEEDFENNIPEKLSEILDMVIFQESNITVQEVFNMVQAIYLRHQMSKKARHSILEFVKILAGPSFKSINISQYYMAKFYKQVDYKNYTFFCKDCNVAIGESMKKLNMKNEKVTCPECQQKYSLQISNPYHYITINIEHQLKSFLSDDLILKNILDNEKSARLKINEETSVITDIHDSELYKKNAFIRSRAEDDVVLTLNINSDGAAVFNNSKFSLWPILAIINELPVHLRFKCLLLGGAVYTNHEPNFKLMDLYMTSFLKELHKLMNTGIKISNNSGKVVNVFVIPLCLSVDSVARPIIAGRMQFNAYEGCHWCDFHGTYAAKAMRYPIIKVKFSDRTHMQTIQNGLKAEETNSVVQGVRGYSSICKLVPSFDCIWGYPIEYMHGILLGCVRQLWDEWTNTRCELYLNPAKRKEIDNRLTNIKPTKEIYRLPSALKKKGKWKAAEWLFWLLFYSIPCLFGILDDEGLYSFALLVKSIYTLLGKEISESMLKKCHKDLKKFVTNCEKLYGIRFMTFNIHSLMHICTSVRKSGPLWSTSAFPFESKIGDLKKYISGPKGVTDQLCNGIAESVTFRNYVLKMVDEKPSSIFCKNTLSNSLQIINFKRSKENAVIPVNENQIESNIFNRCVFRKTVFHSTLYNRPKRTNNTIVKLYNGTIVQIKHFFFIDDACFARVQPIYCNFVKVKNVKLDHILSITSFSDETADVSINEFEKKIILVEVSSEFKFLCIPPCIMDVQ